MHVQVLHSIPALLHSGRSAGNGGKLQHCTSPQPCMRWAASAAAVHCKCQALRPAVTAITAAAHTASGHRCQWQCSPLHEVGSDCAGGNIVCPGLKLLELLCQGLAGWRALLV